MNELGISPEMSGWGSCARGDTREYREVEKGENELGKVGNSSWFSVESQTCSGQVQLRFSLCLAPV